MADEYIEDIRVLIPDTDEIYGPNSDQYLFTDTDYARFYRVGRNSTLRAAGLAMIAVGNSEAMIQKVLVTQDLETDGSKLQDKWRLAGERLLIQADKADLAVETFQGFDLIEYGEGWRRYPAELTEYETAPWGNGYGN